LAECDSEVCVSIYFADGTERRRDPGQLSATETCLQGWRPNAWLRGEIGRAPCRERGEAAVVGDARHGKRRGRVEEPGTLRQLASAVVLAPVSAVNLSSIRRHTMFSRDWSSDVCSSDLGPSAIPRCASRSTLPMARNGAETQANSLRPKRAYKDGDRTPG